MARPTPLVGDHPKLERSARFDSAAAEKCGIIGASLYLRVCVLRTAQPVNSPHSVCVLHVFSLRLPLRCEKVSKVAAPIESMLTFGRIVLPTAWTLQRPGAKENDPVGGSLPSEVLPHRRGRQTPSISGERLSVSQWDGDPLPHNSRRTRALSLCCEIGKKWSSDLLAILRIFSNFRSASVPM